MKRLFLKFSSVAVAATLLKACGGGGGDASPIAGPAPGPGAPPPPPPPPSSPPPPPPAPPPPPPPPPAENNKPTLLQAAQANSLFSTLAYAVEKAGLTNALNNPAANLTLFAADNAAFNALASRIGLGNGRALVDTLAGTGHLADLLSFHLLPGQLAQSQLAGRPDTLYTYGGSPAELIFVNENGQLNLWDASGRTNIVITQADVQASNGVMHVISAVLVPRGVLTVSQMVRANDQYSSLFGAALTPAVIQEIDSGSFTLFVPRDDSPNGNVPLTTKVMRHHIVPGIVSAAAFPPGGAALTLTTLIGQSITLTPGTQAEANSGTLARIRDSSSTPAVVVDVEFNATNGVIHTINKRLLPSGGT